MIEKRANGLPSSFEKRKKKGFREDGGQKILSLARVLIGDIR